MLGDFRIEELAVQRFEAFVRAFLVRTHEAAVTRDIRRENSGQPTFDAPRGQSGAPQPHGPNGSSVPGRILKVNATAGIPFRQGGPSGLRLLRRAEPGARSEGL